jgi:hypothetical protein
MLLLTTSDSQLMEKKELVSIIVPFWMKYWMTLHANWNELEFN